MICSDGAEFRDLVEVDDQPYASNYIYWDKEFIIYNVAKYLL